MYWKVWATCYYRISLSQKPTASNATCIHLFGICKSLSLSLSRTSMCRNSSMESHHQEAWQGLFWKLFLYHDPFVSASSHIWQKREAQTEEPKPVGAECDNTIKHLWRLQPRHIPLTIFPLASLKTTEAALPTAFAFNLVLLLALVRF